MAPRSLPDPSTWRLPSPNESRADFAVLNQRIALTPIRKLWIAWRTWVGAKR